MTSVADLLGPEILARLAKPANLRLGREIVEDGGVAWIGAGPTTVAAKVGGVPAAEQRRTVELRATQAGLEWSCACTRRKDLFCKHCVAVALALR
jgi:uncharacterized Zn finger protein